MRKIILFAALLPLLSANCDQSADEAGLFGKKWWLTKIYTKEGAREVSVKKPFIRFDKEKRSAGGNAGCNSFGGTLSLEKGKVSITEIFSTKMYCEGIQPMEDLFLGDLGQVDRFEIKDNKLLLYKKALSYTDKELLLEFEGESLSSQ
jgi:heat shock protein HslJ